MEHPSFVVWRRDNGILVCRFESLLALALYFCHLFWMLVVVGQRAVHVRDIELQTVSDSLRTLARSPSI